MQIGQQIPIPVLGEHFLKSIINTSPLLQVFTMATGAQYTKPTLFSIGMGPYMGTLILFSALQAVGIGENWSQDHLKYLQRIVVLLIASIQSYQMIVDLGLLPSSASSTARRTALLAILILIAGTLLVTWIADMNNAGGIGGLGIMIIPGIISSTIQTFSGHSYGVKLTMTPIHIFWLTIITLIFSFITIYLNKAEVRLPIQHVLIDNSFADSYLPIKVLTSGAMPAMFSMFLFLLPKRIFLQSSQQNIREFVRLWFSYTTIQGVCSYAIIVLLLSYLFSYMNLLPHRVAEDFRKNGDYFFNIMPGDETEVFLEKHLNRLMLVGNIYLVLITAGPLLLGLWYPVATLFSFYFTSLYILITILANIVIQVQALYQSSHYKLI